MKSMTSFGLAIIAATVVLSQAAQAGRFTNLQKQAASQRGGASIGIGNSGIIGGTNVDSKSDLAKSIVGIYIQLGDKGGAICTGSLLPNNIVLTAAHCIGPDPKAHFIVFSPDLNNVLQSQDKTAVQAVVRRSVATVVHSGWGKNKTGNDAWDDVALIKFAGDVPAGFQPATFLSSSDLLKKDGLVTIAGYGVNSDKLILVKPSDDPNFNDKVKSGEYFCDNDDMSKARCYKEETDGSGLLRTTQLKIGGFANSSEVILVQKDGQAACEGDSGGPAYVQVGGQYKLWGATSRGTRGCNNLVIYTDVLEHMDWIKQNATSLH